jgi:AraC family transcriptional regulator of adaptative response / DNA-3-methyladenine glycosylase II
MLPDSERLWQALEARDPRFDGWFFCGVKTTGIYCRPSCPARTPKHQNVRFFPTAAAAQSAGFRACKRCRPDATPGSPEWDRRADLVGRAMRLIADGVVDREGVTGLATRLGYAERHVHRQLVAVVGAGPLAIARARRAQNARILLETTSLPITSIAFASGFRSVRQFNDTVREVFASTPSALRSRTPRDDRAARDSGAITLRLPFREPFDGDGLLAFLALRVVEGVEEVDGCNYRRSLRLPHGDGIVELDLGHNPVHVPARFILNDMRDLGAAVHRCRILLDLDSDPLSVFAALEADATIGKLVKNSPGRRVPGHVDPHELAVRAVLGQQISVRSAATHAARLAQHLGQPLKAPVGSVTHTFPAAEAIADADPQQLAMPQARQHALKTLAAALADGDLVLDDGADREHARTQLLSLPGIGPWTADYVAMRALRDPDAFLATDLGVRHAVAALGHGASPIDVAQLAENWRPYRAYALQHLWASLAAPHAPVTTLTPRTVRAAAAA